jgi:plastocyanin
MLTRKLKGASSMQPTTISRRVPRYLAALGVLAIAVVLVIAAFVGVHLKSAAASTTPLVIKMIDTPATYSPAKITIRVGETVEWENVGNSVHHASSDPSSAVNPADVSSPPGAKPFDSGFLQPGQTFTFTFKYPGTYRYICAPHETSGMMGEVVVK